jgi:Mn2+/Fe2+ NRAMP family transporter
MIHDILKSMFSKKPIPKNNTKKSNIDIISVTIVRPTITPPNSYINSVLNVQGVVNWDFAHKINPFRKVCFLLYSVSFPVPLQQEQVSEPPSRSWK